MADSPCSLVCDPRLVGDPVDTATGGAIDETLDFRLTGPLELWWTRHYDSSRSHQRFALGWGHTHEYDRALHFDVDGMRYLLPLGRTIAFPALPRDGDVRASQGYRLRRLARLRYLVEHHGEPAFEFEFAHPDRAARVRRICAGEAEIRFDYDADGRWLGLVDSAGRYLRVETDGQGRLAGLTWDRGPTEAAVPLVAYRYDERGNLVATRDSSGAGFTLAYDGQNRLTQRVGRKGFSFFFTYDALGRCIRSVGDGGMHDVRLEYDPSGLITRVTQADGGVWTYVFDEPGVLARIVDPLGGIRAFRRDDAGRLAAEVDPNGNAALVRYDDAGAAVARVGPDGRRVELPEDPAAPDRPPHRVAGNPAEYELGRLLRLRDVLLPSAGEASILPIPAEARRLVVTRQQAVVEPTSPPRPLGPVWWPPPRRGRVFNDLGKLVRQDDPLGRSRHWRYDASGNVVEHADFDGSVWRWDCGRWHLRLGETDPLGGTVRLAYNRAGDVAVCTDAGGTRSEYVYDPNEHLVEVRRHGRTRDRYLRDAAGNLVAKHAGDGRLLFQVEVGPGNVPLKRTLASGDEHAFEYDKRGRRVVAASASARVELEYDRFGNRCREQRDGLGVELRFEGRNRPLAARLLGGFPIRYDRSIDGTLIVTDPGGRKQRIRVLPHGLVEKRFSNGSREVAQYDDLGRCLFKHVRLTRSGEWSRVYEWSGEGELRRVRDSRYGDVRHEYDAAHRLRRRWNNGGQPELYDLDAAGNLLRQPGLDDVAPAPGNRLASANGGRIAFDDRDHVAGRETPAGLVRYTYDERDRLVRIDLPAGVWRAEYDALGRRIRKHWAGETTEYYWSQDQLLAELRFNGSVRLYLYADALALAPLAFMDYPAIDAPPGSGTRYFIFADQIGTPCLVEDEAGAEVWRARIDPYGRAVVAPGATIELNLRFPGHYFDPETGLHYNRFRYYDPVLGRYLQSDPWGLAGGYNLYAYPANPLLRVDVRGLGEENTKKSAPEEEDGDEEGTPPPSSHGDGDDDDPSRRFPPRTKAAVDAADAAQKAYQAAIADMTGQDGDISARNRPAVLSVMTFQPDEDGNTPPTAVGVTSIKSADNTPENNAALIGAMQDQLGPNYAVTNTPMDTSGFAPAQNDDGSPYPGNSSTCAEPRAANAANGIGGDPEGMDTRWVGRGANPHPADPTGDPALDRPNQMNPCPSCDKNQGAMMDHATANSGGGPGGGGSDDGQRSDDGAGIPAGNAGPDTEGDND